MVSRNDETRSSNETVGSFVHLAEVFFINFREHCVPVMFFPDFSEMEQLPKHDFRSCAWWFCEDNGTC